MDRRAISIVCKVLKKDTNDNIDNVKVHQDKSRVFKIFQVQPKILITWVSARTMTTDAGSTHDPDVTFNTGNLPGDRQETKWGQCP